MRIEPGDDSILKISPSFQATQSNMNRAHGGKRPKFYDIIMNNKGAELIYYTIHNEEGARFWKKSNWNVIVKLKNPYDKRIKGENYRWVSFKQIKKLALKNRYVNPFVKQYYLFYKYQCPFNEVFKKNNKLPFNITKHDISSIYFNNIFENIIKCVELKKNITKILDFGCGNGYLKKRLGNNKKIKVIGYDM